MDDAAFLDALTQMVGEAGVAALLRPVPVLVLTEQQDIKPLVDFISARTEEGTIKLSPEVRTLFCRFIRAVEVLKAQRAAVPVRKGKAH